MKNIKLFVFSFIVLVAIAFYLMAASFSVSASDDGQRPTRTPTQTQEGQRPTWTPTP